MLLSTLKKPDGSFTEGLQDTLEIMIDHFVATDDYSSDNNHQIQIRSTIQEPLYTPDDFPFSTSEILNSTKQIDSNKTPGIDGFNSNFFVFLLDVFPKFITALFNKFLTTSTFPRCWKVSKIIPIIKPGKENSYDLSKFRPISLISVGAKILEKLMINRIMHHLYSNNYLSNNQYGFTPQHSSTDAIMAAKEFINTHLSYKEQVLLISLDVRGAFDAAWWPAILNQLREFQCPNNIYKLACDYFTDRYGFIETNSVKIERKCSKGCPQGSCCGPGFWIILYNSLITMFTASNIKIIAFADDILILISRKTHMEVEMVANSMLHQVQNWAIRNKLEFNPTKSKILSVTRQRNQPKYSVYLNCEKLEQVSELKYLGVIFDSQFSWNSHINYVTSKCSQIVHQLSRTAKVYWGLGSDALRIIYTGAILPLLLYAVPVWIKALDQSYNQKKLRRVQRLITIRIVKGYRTISYDAACIIADVVPILLKAKEYVALYNRNLNIFGIEQDYVIEKQVPKEEWMHPALEPFICSIHDYFQPKFSIYTDGSKIDNHVGCSFVVYVEDQIIWEQQFHLDDICSNNQAELLAILQALRWLEEQNIGEKTAIIKSDSQISLNSLENCKNRFEMVEMIRWSMKKLVENGWLVYFQWVKAHCGLAGNERADQLAKEAALDTTLPIAYNKTPISKLKALCREANYLSWEQQWAATPNGAVTKEYFRTVSSRQAANHLVISPRLTQALTGHGGHRAYLYRFNLDVSAACSCELGSDQTWSHLILECPQYEPHRASIIRHALTTGDTWPLSEQKLVSIKYFKFFYNLVNNIILNN